jgi:metallo-beta-lactamase family protein
MKLQFWGAARTVTGSMHLLEVNGKKILLDCGLFQGKRQLSYERNLNLPFEPKEIDVLVLSHAHIDHSGNIPNLVRQGFRGNIYTTHATRDLCSTMLMDSARIQEQDIAYLNKKRRRKGEGPLRPLYTTQDALNALPYFIGVPYHRPLPIAPGVTLTLYDAGHILGSAMVVLDIEEQGKPQQRLVFSGDLGRSGLTILRDPEFIDQADYLIMESTYGSRYHESFDDATRKLREISVRAFKRKGRMLVPSFAVGRTQELVYRLNTLRSQHKIPEFPIYVDSPLAVNVTEIFRLHPECYDEETLHFMANSKHRSPFGFHLLRYVRSVDDSKALNFAPDPLMIIAASGMCEGGRILHHLKNHIQDANTTILFTGYQAANTLGRKILDGVSPVRIFGDMYEVRAHVERIDGYSAHADRAELLDWAHHFDRGKLKRIFLVHGEEDGYTALASGLEQMGFTQVIAPQRGDAFQL